MSEFMILGGDKRYEILCRLLEDCEIYSGKFMPCRAVIAPIPFSKDGKTVFETKITIEEFFKEMKNNKIPLFFGGVIDEKVKLLAELYNIKAVDFFKLENIAVLNAVATAEGALQTAMLESEITVFSSKCLVLGYGRCGKILSKLLKSVGAEVSVSYRNKNDKAYITAYNMKAVDLKDISAIVSEFDFIFNTIPSTVIDKNILGKMNRDSVIIDIAQAPGGVEYTEARRIGIKAVYCPGLPGRVAPYTSAVILKDEIMEQCGITA